MMRLSDALALGRTLLHPHAGYVRISDIYNGKAGDGGCALGMIEAAGSTERAMRGWIREQFVVSPCRCGRVVEPLSNVIIHLFDGHVAEARQAGPYKDWNIDKLIDWLRSVEDASGKFAEAPVAAPVEEAQECTVAHS